MSDSNVSKGSDTVMVPAEELERIYAELARALGASPGDADLFSQAIACADLRGKDTQGIAALPLLYDGYVAGGIRFDAAPEVVDEGPGFLTVSGNHAPGQVVAAWAMDRAVEKARTAGIAAVWMRETNDIAMASSYVLRAVGQRCIGLVMSNGVPLTAPWGGREPLFGTSPLAFAIPAGRYDPIVHDAGLSAVTHGVAVMAAREGRTLDRKVLIDQAGELTDDPRGLVVDPYDRNSPHLGALPPIDPKSAGWLFFVDIVAGILSGMTASHDVPHTSSREEPTTMGQWLLAIDVERMLPYERFCDRVDALIERTISMPPMAGEQTVRYPGQTPAETERRRRETGVPVSRWHWKTLGDIARRHGVEPSSF